MSKMCICKVSDAEVRKVAKARNLPLKWLRDIKKMHRRFKVHEWLIREAKP